eukprot:512437_1
MYNWWLKDEVLEQFECMKIEKTLAFIIYKMAKKNSKEMKLYVEHSCSKTEVKYTLNSLALIKYFNIILSHFIRINNCDDQCYNSIYFAMIEQFMDFDNYCQIFVNEMLSHQNEPRFGVIDWNNKLVFVSWQPETANGKDKMRYASIREGFIQSLVGLYAKIQAYDASELSVQIIEEKTRNMISTWKKT